MEGWLKLGTAANITVLVVDSADWFTGKTGLSAGLTIYASKAGAAPAVITPTVTELDATNVKGIYKLALTTAHTDTLGELLLHITGAGAVPGDIKWQVSTNLPGESSPQTGDNFARLGVAGAGLTALGDTRIANLDAAVSSRSIFAGGAVASVTADVGITQGAADKVWGSAARSLTTFGTLVADVATAVWGAATRLLTAGTNIVLAKGVGVTGLNDIAAGAAMTLTGAYDAAKTAAQAGAAMALTAPERESLAAVVEAHLLNEGDSQMLINAIVAAIGNTNMDQTVLIAAIRADIERAGGSLKLVQAKTDQLAFSVANQVDANALSGGVNAAGVRAAVGLASANLDTQLADLPTNAELAAELGAIPTVTPPTAAAVADAVWDEAEAGHTLPGTMGEAMTMMTTQGDPWGAVVPAAYPAGTAGYKFGGLQATGAGAITWRPEIATNSTTGLPLADTDTWCTTDQAGINVIASGKTGQDGLLTTPWMLDAGPVWVFRQKTGFSFTPAQETVQ